MREAAAFDIIEALLAGGAVVKAFDPQAMETTKKVLGNTITYSATLDECTKDADAVALVTDWNEFITQDFTKVAKLMKGKHIFDGRNCLASGRVAAAGLHYYAVGRPDVKPGQGRPGSMGVVNAG